MHFKKLLSFLGSLGCAFMPLKGLAQTPTISASTNYVATGQKLLLSGSGFATNESITVFVNGPRVPIGEIMTDSNGCFSADVTYYGPYCDTNVQYRLNPTVEGGAITTNAYYQAAEAENIKGISIVHSFIANPNEPLMDHVRITAHVGASGAYYELFTSPDLTGWKPMNMIRNNGTIGDTDLIWDFETAACARGFFRVGKPLN